MKALRYGFGSVMFDGSIYPVDENIRISAEIATIAHAMGAGLECELGKVGGLEEGEGEIGVDQLTEASEVTTFLEKTNADFLAISIGTTHGVYAKAPNLDLERLAEIRIITDIPLVLHGGSGLTDLDYKNCIAGGIQKINTFTDVVNAAIETARGISEDAPYVELSKLMEDAMYDAVALKIKTYGSDGKA